MLKTFKLCCFMLSWVALVSASQAGPFVLVEEGQAKARVVVADKTPLVDAAVKDLVEYVEKISGAKLEVVEGREDLPGPTLHLGRTIHAASLEKVFDEVVTDGFVMRKVGEDLIVTGAIPEGTANGITTMLIEQFGVRWYFPGALWEVYPSRQTLMIDIKPTHETDTQLVNPSFAGRQLWGAQEGTFSRRMRMTQSTVKLPYTGTGHHLVHVVNPDLFGDKPEYFAYWDGKRHVERGEHPCFSHPDMERIFTDYVLEKNGSLGVNDNQSACRCERCLKIDGHSEPYMGMYNVSESYFQLIKKVAANVYEKDPNKPISVFAYQITNVPPKTVDHLGPNVSLLLCQDTAQYFDDNYKRIDMSMSTEWASKCDHIRFYDYIGLSHWTPRYFPHILAEQMRHLATIGIEGYGTHHGSMTDSSMPMFYLLYQLLWNADTDPDKAIDQMLTDLYGESVEPIREFYALWEEVWERQTKSKWLNSIDNFRGEMALFTPEDFKQSQTLLTRAESLANDEKVKARLALLRAHHNFTQAAANAYYVSMNALESRPGTIEEAEQLAANVAQGWTDFTEAYDRTDRMPSPLLSGWASKTFRVRMWSLKQQFRDAVIAPYIRWITAHELDTDPDELAALEQRWRSLAIAQRTIVEKQVTEKVGALYRLPRADGVMATPIPEQVVSYKARSFMVDWEDIPSITTCAWVYRDRSPTTKPGKYDEPLDQYYLESPREEDHSITWKAAWDRDALYLQAEVRDDRHVQDRDAEHMWEQDSLQIALNHPRDEILYDVHSWTYLWGGYRGTELEFGIGYQDHQTLEYVWETPNLVNVAEATRRIQTRASRHGDRILYEAVVPWDLLPGFHPADRQSVGISLVVNEVDEGDRRISAEYSSGVVRAKRPGEFAALRLIGLSR